MSGKSFSVLAALVSMCLMAFVAGCAVPEKEEVRAAGPASAASEPTAKQDALQQEEKAGLEEEVKEEEILEVSRICDVLFEYVFRKQFDEAKKLLEKSKGLIQQLVDEKAAHEHAAVGNGYKMWQSGLADVLQILSSTELGGDEKKTKAMNALDRAAQAKRAAAFAETFE
jgi:hypothetical protein